MLNKLCADFLDNTAEQVMEMEWILIALKFWDLAGSGEKKNQLKMIYGPRAVVWESACWCPDLQMNIAAFLLCSAAEDSIRRTLGFSAFITNT